MARTGISYEQVQAVADAMLGQGKQPTIAAVREALGTGSPNTIHGHLVKWRSARPVAQSAAHELPADLVNAFGRELAKAAATARAELEIQLVQAQAEAQELSAAGESLETQLADIMEQLTEATSERDAAAVIVTERAAEISRLLTEVERERSLSSDAQIETATLRLRAEAHIERLDAQAKEIQALKDALSKSELARQIAVTESAVARAKHEAAEKAHEQAQERERVAVAHAAQVDKKLASVTAELANANVSIQAGQSRLEAAARENEDLKKSNTAAKLAAKEAGELAAELKGRLAALSQNSSTLPQAKITEENHSGKVAM